MSAGRYMLFCGTRYYPEGGMQDRCGGVCDSVDEALEFLDTWRARNEGDLDWYHVADMNTGDIVFVGVQPVRIGGRIQFCD